MRKSLQYLSFAAVFAMINGPGLPCHAHFTGLQAVLHTTVTTSLGPRKVYRIYANFTAPADRLLFWGSPVGQSGPTTLQTGPCESFSFFNIGGSTAPDLATIDKNPETQWDTFATIGVSIYDQGVPWD